MGLAPSENRENIGKLVVAKVPVPIFSQPLRDVLTIQGLSVAEVAQTLPRSKGWVSMWRRLLDEMSPAIQAVLFRGTLTHSAARPCQEKLAGG